MQTRNTVATIGPLLQEAQNRGLITRWEEWFSPSGMLKYKIYHPPAPRLTDRGYLDHNKYGGVFDLYTLKEAAIYLRAAFNTIDKEEE